MGLKQPLPKAFPRQHQRFKPSGVRCSLGEVLDLSAGGLRVQLASDAELRVGKQLEISIGPVTAAVRPSVRVVWMRRSGWKRWEAGLMFVSADERTVRVVVGLARTGRVPPEDAWTGTPASASNPASKPVAPAAPADPNPEKAKPAPSGPVASDVPDLYGILSVSPDADDATIHAAFRALARKLHPDLNKEEGASARFAEISKAYQVLKDVETRARYDAFRVKLRQAG